MWADGFERDQLRSQQFLRQKKRKNKYGLNCEKTDGKAIFLIVFCILASKVEKSADGNQAAAGMRSAGGGTMMPVFWISVWDGSSW